jgi:hypothetical protein
MSTFAVGTGGTVVSSNLPAALLELAYILQARERVTPDVDAISITLDSNARIATFTNALPIVSSVDASGAISISATDYLSNNAFANGGGTLKSTTVSDAFLELSQLILSAQQTYNAANSTLTPLTQVSVAVDPVGLIATITGALPFTETIVTGRPTIIATDYLP